MCLLGGLSLANMSLFFQNGIVFRDMGILIAQAGLKVEPQRVFLAYFVARPPRLLGEGRVAL